jgi:hypothetical protein
MGNNKLAIDELNTKDRKPVPQTQVVINEKSLSEDKPLF